MGVSRKCGGDPSGLIASRLTPTLDLWRSQISCGSEPARDGGLIGAIKSKASRIYALTPT
ncbi:hypothetical protein EJA72_03815 [Pseudomonas sp. PB120]|nr:hypothetical protein [Pseudomonas sp. PB120]